MKAIIPATVLGMLIGLGGAMAQISPGTQPNATPSATPQQQQLLQPRPDATTTPNNQVGGGGQARTGQQMGPGGYPAQTGVNRDSSTGSGSTSSSGQGGGSTGSGGGSGSSN